MNTLPLVCNISERIITTGHIFGHLRRASTEIDLSDGPNV